jgi:hypothetical protein
MGASRVFWGRRPPEADALQPPVLDATWFRRSKLFVTWESRLHIKRGSALLHRRDVVGTPVPLSPVSLVCGVPLG